jgi:hypothetical protein
LDKKAKDLQPVLLSKRGQSSNSSAIFHTSTILKMMQRCQRGSEFTVRHAAGSAASSCRQVRNSPASHPPMEKAHGSQVQAFRSQTGAPGLADGSECRVPRVKLELDVERAEEGITPMSAAQDAATSFRVAMTRSPNTTMTTFQVVDRLERRGGRDA